MIILIILIIVLLLSLILINKTLKKKDNILENVKLQENTYHSKSFSMYVENDNGEYEEYVSSNMFPNEYYINLDKSKCIDNLGNEVKNVLSGYGNKVTITSNKTIFCYVYFDKFCKEGETLSNCLVRNSNEGAEEIWNSPLEDDGYRYVGTDPNNYICFGTTNKEECINDTDKYMYRIIGIFEDENGNSHTKLIKKEALNTTYAWHSDYHADVDWNERDLYKGLNGSYFLTNTSYPYMQDTKWTNKISTWNYTMTNTKSDENCAHNLYGAYYTYETGKTIYLHELNRSGKANESCHDSSNTLSDCNVGEWKNLSTKVSLMYVSDYALSLGEAALSYTSNSNHGTMKTGWMNLVNNDSDFSNSWEWTMSRLGCFGGLESAWLVTAGGIVNYNYVGYLYAARPVFFLESDVEFSTNSGDGSITNPYLIK